MQVNPFYISYPVCQVKPWGLVLYQKKEWSISTRRKEEIIEKAAEPKPGKLEKAYTGVLTPSAKRKLKKAIQLLVAIAEEKEAPNFKTGGTFKFRVNFITLTLPSSPGSISDTDLKKKCLDNFLKRCKRKHGLKSYVWRAERQKNGNLHFHLISDTWLHYEKIRNDWNACLNQFGLIDKFEKKHGHKNPNSTDIHAVWKVKNLSQYFIKYMSKDSPDQDQIEGKVWDCSKNLKSRKKCEVEIQEAETEIINEAIADPNVVVKEEDFFTLIFLNPTQHKHYVRDSLSAHWLDYLNIVRSSA